MIEGRDGETVGVRGPADPRTREGDRRKGGGREGSPRPCSLSSLSGWGGGEEAEDSSELIRLDQT